MAGTTVAETMQIVWEVVTRDKGTKQLLAGERQVQRATQETARAMAQQDRAAKRSAQVAEQASRRQVRAAHATSAAQKRAQEGLLRRGAGSAAGAGRHAVGIVAGIASVATAEKAVSVTEQLAKTTLTLHKSFGVAVKDASRWAAVSQARGADGKQMTMGFKALATQIRAATQATGKQAEAADRLREKNALRIAQAEEDASRMKDQTAARRKLNRVQEAAARSEAELAKKSGTSAKLFEQLGISQQELVKHGNDMNWVLRAVSDGLGHLPAGTDKAAISAKLFGRTWTTIAPLVRDGSKAMQDQLAMADKYGATMGGETVKELQAHIKAEREAKLAVLGLQVAFGTKVAPTLTKIIEKTSEFAAQMHSGAGAGGRFARQARQIGDDLAPVGNALKTVGRYLAEHPRLVVAAAGAYTAFKAARGTLKIVNDIRAISSAITAVAKRAAKTRLASILADGAKGTGRLTARALGNVTSRVTSIMASAGAAGADAFASSTGEAMGKSGGKFREAGKGAGKMLVRGMIAGAILSLPLLISELQKQITDKLGLSGGLKKFGETPGHSSNPLEAFKKLFGFRRGGVAGRFASGGLVPIMAAGGELLVDGGRAAVVPGDPRRDATPIMARPGTAVLTGDGQARLAAGSSLMDAVRTQAPHFARGGMVTGSYVATAYGPPWGGIQGGGTTATGVNLRRSPHVYGVAVDPSLIPLGSQLYAWPNPFNRSGPFRAFDTGGAIKGRRLDFYDWRGRRSQNRWGSRSVKVSRARIHAVGRGPSAAEQEDLMARVPIVMGASRSRAGLLDDALAQGVAAGQSGLTRAEIARGLAGARGARRSPVMDAIRGAMGPTVREVTIPAKDAGSGSIVGNLPSGVVKPMAAWNPARRPVAKWIVPYLSWAAGHGWKGTVVSGYRSLAEQRRIWNSGVRPAARPGTSNHEGAAYPRGAVDVSSAARLAAVLARRPGAKLLRWAGAKDPVHFSHPHGGSYRRGGVVGSAGYYRSRFGERYRGFYLWARYGQGRGLGRHPGSGAWYGALDDYFGGRHGWQGKINDGSWREKWTTAQRFRAGGVVGGRLGSALSGAMTMRGGSLDALDAAIGMAVGARLDELRAEVLRRVRRGGSKRTIQRLQSVIDLIDFEIGRRIGRIEDVVEQRAARLERFKGAADRGMRLLGLDADSPRGVAAQAKVQAVESQVQREQVASLQRALKQARRSGNREVIREVEGRLHEAQDALAESLVRQVELWRDQLRALGQEAVNAAQFRLGLTQSFSAGIEAQQRLAGTQDTPGGMVQRAQVIMGATIPALQQQQAASQFAAQMASAAGDLNGWRTAVQDAAQAAVDIANAQADAADLLREAAAKAASDLVDAASHGRSMADLGLQRLDLEQQLIGTHDTTAGAMGRADFIKTQIVPAIQGEIEALKVQQATAQLAGDKALATQIAEAIYAKENDVLQSQLDAMNAVKDNTDVLKEFGGSTAFSYQGQVQTDIDVIRARLGA